MVAPISVELSQFFPTPLPSPAPSLGIDPFAPNFVGTVSKMLKRTIAARCRSDDSLLSRVRDETAEGMEVYRLHLLEDEVQYRRDEESVVIQGIAKLLTRLALKEHVDMPQLSREAAAKRKLEDEERERLARERAILEDIQRRAEAARQQSVDRKAQRVRREAHVQELGRRYPGTPGAIPFASRLNRDIPRRRTFSNGLDLEQAKAVFDACGEVVTERRRRREEEIEDRSFTLSTSSDNSIMEEDEEDASDVDEDNEDNELTIHGSGLKTILPVVIAAPPVRNRNLEYLRKEWYDARSSVDKAYRDWDFTKARHAYNTLWVQLQTAKVVLSQPLTFSTFPWPLMATPSAPYDISVKDIAEFLYHGLASTAAKQKALDGAMIQWHADNFVRAGIVQQITPSEVETVKMGQMIVFSCLQELAQSFAKA